MARTHQVDFTSVLGSTKGPYTLNVRLTNNPSQSSSITTPERITGAVTTTAPSTLTGLGYNASLDFNAFNVLLTTTVPVKVRVTRNDLPIGGTVLANNAPKFVDPAGAWVGYSNRVRLDRLVSGVGGVQPGDVLKVAITPTAGGTTYVQSFTANAVTSTNPVAISLGSSGNQPPVVAQAIPAQTATVGVAFSYTIPSNTFSDSDGTITGITVANLPAGLIYNGTTRVVAGIPVTPGVVTAQFTGIDDDGATVVAPWTVTVNNPPSTGDADLLNRTFTGEVIYGWQTDTSKLNLTATLVDGKVKLTNGASFTVPSDRLLRYSINGGPLTTTLANWESLPGEPILVLMLFVRKATDGSPLDPPYTIRANSSIHVESSLTVY